VIGGGAVGKGRVAMDWQRFAIMAMVEVIKELTRRLGMHDLSDKCTECGHEIEAATAEQKKEG
jgi:hypothetical protein